MYAGLPAFILNAVSTHASRMVRCAQGNGMPRKVGMRMLSTSGPPKAISAITLLNPSSICAPLNELNQLRIGSAPGVGHWARRVRHEEKPTQRMLLKRALVPGNQLLSTLDGSEMPPLLPCPV